MNCCQVHEHLNRSRKALVLLKKKNTSCEKGWKSSYGYKTEKNEADKIEKSSD